MLNRSGGAIPYDIVTAVVPSADNIYMGLDGGGLCIYNSRSGTSRTLTTANSNIAGNNVISMQKDGDRLWMAIYTKGLTAYDISTGKFTLYPMPAGSAGNSNVWTICDDGMGRIWVGGPRLDDIRQTHPPFHYPQVYAGHGLRFDCLSWKCGLDRNQQQRHL
jgi:streptogramin lyase